MGSPNPMLSGVALARRTADKLVVEPPPPAVEGSFSALFDGTEKTFQRWKSAGPGAFALQDGLLIAQPSGDHTVAFYAAERFDNPYFVHATTHAFEQMIGVMCVVGGGILETFPKLKVVFLEAGAGWVPYWMERLDEHYEYMSPAVPLMKKMPSEYMKSENVYYSFEPDEHTLNFVMDYIGEDRLVFASDYNHGDSKFPHTVKAVTERKNLSEKQLQKLMCDNAVRLYNI